MSNQDQYEQWKNERSNPQVDRAFADGVMEKIRLLDARHSPNGQATITFRSRPIGRWTIAAAILAGISLQLAHVAGILAVLLSPTM